MTSIRYKEFFRHQKTPFSIYSERNSRYEATIFLPSKIEFFARSFYCFTPRFQRELKMEEEVNWEIDVSRSS